MRFPGLRLYPQFFKMRHYLFLSVPHALRKWHPCLFRFYETEVEKGWASMRAGLTPEKIRLPSQKELRRFTSDDELDPSNPLTRHLWPLA